MLNKTFYLWSLANCVQTFNTIPLHLQIRQSWLNKILLFLMYGVMMHLIVMDLENNED